MSRTYTCLKKQCFQSGEYSLVPLRDQDKYSIMRWRNEQVIHLRQQNLLTPQDQDRYFEQTVAALFKQDQPTQVLFSYLKGDQCIGYGGLVHISHPNRNAEISFLMDTSLEEDFFEFHWQTYLPMIEEVAFDQLGLHKIYTWAYDLRPRVYPALEASGFQQEARLAGHCLFNGKFIDVLIHSKFNRHD